MKLVWMSLRNLARNRRRTALSVAVVTAGAVALILTSGFVRFSFQGLREALVLGGLGHLQVARAEAVEGRAAALERPVREGLEDWRALRREVEAVPGVVAASPTVHLMGMVSVPGEGSASFVGLGVDPERERRMGFETEILAGEGLADEPPAEGADRVVLARGLAESLGVGPGDLVTLLALAPHGMLNALDAEVAGVHTTGVSELDTRFLRLHVASAQRLLQTEGVSDLVVTLDETERTGEVARELRRRLAGRTPELAVVPWHERTTFYDQVRNLYLGIFWFLGSVIAVLVVLSASNTLVMSVMERIREIGTLRALGTGRGQVALLVVGEALWLGLAGGLLGDAAGLGATALLNSLDLQMPPPPGAVNPIDLRLAVVPEALVGVPLLMLAVLAVSAALPALRAVRLSIVEALGHV